MSGADAPASAPAVPSGFRHLTLDRIGSTNDEAQRFARAGEPAGLIVTATEQTQGRGRQRRTWLSPVGGLYCSFLLRPECPLRRAPELGFLVAVAVAEAVNELLGAGDRISCKWPNDVLVGGRKIAGILVESSATAGNQLEWVVAGIGINLRQHPPPAEVMFPATCVAEEGAPGITPAEALAPLAARMGYWLARWQCEGFGPVRDAWRGWAHRPGDPLLVRLGDDEVMGEFVDLDVDGALILQTQQGRRLVTAGDCFPVKPSSS
jgi:birA, biotin-[acetyl-CoA-carboxylase] ligase region